MRSLFLPLLILPLVAGAQTLPYRRVEAVGPLLPDGYSNAMGITDTGWSLIQTRAANLSAPSRYSYQFYFRSPEGTLTRLPVEKGDTESDPYSDGVLSPDGEFAILRSFRNGPLVRVDRNGLAVRRYGDHTTDSVPVAIVGRNLFSINYGFESGGFSVVKMDVDTGLEKEYPAPLSLSGASFYGFSSDGKRAIYADFTTQSYVSMTLESRVLRSHNYGPDFQRSTLDSDGRYVWTVVPAAGDGNARLVRHDLISGLENDYALPTSADDVYAWRATNRFLFFGTSKSLTPEDTNESRDFYVFDRSNGSVKLLSTRQGSTAATGEANALAVSPKGNLTIFSTSAAGASDLQSNGFNQLLARSTARRDTLPALTAVSPAGAETYGFVASRNGGAVLTSRFAADQWSLRIVKEGQATQVIPTEGQAIPIDVTDDGTRALFKSAGGKLMFWDGGTMRTLDTSDSTAKIDPKTGIVVVLSQSGNARQLLRIDPVNGTSIRLDGATPMTTADYDVDAGRAAWKTADSLRIVDLATGISTVILQTPNRFKGPRLTSDGIYVGVAQTLANGQPDQTRVYRILDGALRRNLSYGELLPDGQWLVDAEEDELIQASNGARVRDSVELNEALGTPVGPVRFTQWFSNGANGRSDIWSYRAVASTLPVTEDLIAEYGSQGWVSIVTSYRKAGLENASTWNEYRVDGAGAWTRVNPDRKPGFYLSEGPHLVEVRAVDALGRVENPPQQITVTPDFTPPIYEQIGIKVEGSGRVDFTIYTDALWVELHIVFPDGKDKIYYNSTGRLPTHHYVNDLVAGQTYRAYYVLKDRAQNSVTTPKKTFVR
ncbi:hypothetical protein EON81_08295 [bacterium]|nr:MAG: hypothetical protein EON81_08295 [bacterium]